MFIPLTTVKGEKIFLNLNKVLFFAESRRSCTVVLDDGTTIELNETYDEVISQFEPLE